MEIYDLRCDKPPRERTVAALGFFDGVHLGHRLLLSYTATSAARLGFVPAVYTFSDDIATFKKTAVRLSEPHVKMRLFGEAGIERVYIADFSSVAGLAPEAFVRRELMERCGCMLAVCGYNFRFGAGAVGTPAMLQALMAEGGGDAAVVAPYLFRGEAVSSTRIRRAIERGDMETASAMLGYDFFIEFPVLEGKKLGRTIGIPTINQSFTAGFVVPRHGVYDCDCVVDGVRYPGVANVGVRPTVEDTNRVNCETHIIGYSGWLYGRRIRVSFRHFMRPEIRFSDLNALKAQIESDIREVVREHEKQ